MGAEFELISHIRARVAVDAAPGFVGIGDDCAVWPPRDGHDLLVSNDLLLEGVHFELETTPLTDLGYKVLAVNLSDIAAMGGEPRFATLALGLPGLPTPFIPLVDAFVDAANAHGVVLAGGDTCASSHGLVISVTVFGEVPRGQAVARTGARAGDGVYVTGTVGDSAAGLTLLKQAGPPPAGVSEQALDGLKRRHLRPSPRCREGILLREEGLASAMIDVSDGLAQDLGHILTASGVGADLEAEAVPLSPMLREYGTACDSDPLEWALYGGEDYELVFTVPEKRERELYARIGSGAIQAARIGTVTAGPERRLLRSGVATPLESRGYEHFR